MELEENIRAYVATKFQNETCVSATEVLYLLRIYLRSGYIEFEETVHSKQDGITIGSCITPLLADIYLAKGDVKLLEDLAPLGATRSFCYVDYFLVCMPLPANFYSGIPKITEQLIRLHVGLVDMNRFQLKK